MNAPAGRSCGFLMHDSLGKSSLGPFSLVACIRCRHGHSDAQQLPRQSLVVMYLVPFTPRASPCLLPGRKLDVVIITGCQDMPCKEGAATVLRILNAEAVLLAHVIAVQSSA